MKKLIIVLFMVIITGCASKQQIYSWIAEDNYPVRGMMNFDFKWGETIESITRRLPDLKGRYRLDKDIFDIYGIPILILPQHLFYRTNNERITQFATYNVHPEKGLYQVYHYIVFPLETQYAKDCFNIYRNITSKLYGRMSFEYQDTSSESKTQYYVWEQNEDTVAFISVEYKDGHLGGTTIYVCWFGPQYKDIFKEP